MDEEIIISSNVAEVADEGMSALDALAGSLSAINAGGGLDGLSSQLQNVSSAIGSIDAAKLDDVGSAIDGIDAGGVASGVDEIATGIDSIDAGPIAEAADEAERLKEASGEAGGAAESAGGLGARAYMKIGKAALQVVGAIIDIGKAAAGAVFDQITLREEMSGMLNQANKGGGGAAFDSLSAMARKLNLDVGETVGTFTRLKKEGATGAQATSLIKMGADIQAVGGSAEDAKDAMKRALDAIKAGGNAQSVISGIAKEFGAVGNGANASAKASLTFTGALKRIAGAKDQAFADIAKGIEPQLNAIGAKLTSVFGNLSIGDTGIIEALGSALEYIPPLIDGMVGAFGTLKAVAGPGIAALQTAFSTLGSAIGSTGGAGSAFKYIAVGIGAVITVVAGAIAAAIHVVSAFIFVLNAVGGAASAVIDAVSGIVDAISSFSLVDAGMNLLNSLAEGITAAIGNAVAAASAAGDAVVGAVKGALGIASPSKIGMGAGINTISSLGTGAEKATPGAVSAFESAGIATGDALTGGVKTAAIDTGINAPSLNGGITDSSGAPRAKSGAQSKGSSIAVDQVFNIYGGDSEEVAHLVSVRQREETIALLKELGLIE